jgi:hypothetical protein
VLIVKSPKGFVLDNRSRRRIARDGTPVSGEILQQLNVQIVAASAA